MATERLDFSVDPELISRLPRKQQEVVGVFRNQPDISFSQAGELLGGVTKQAVNDAEKRARRNLQKLQQGIPLRSGPPMRQPEPWQLDVLKGNPSLGVNNLAPLVKASPQVVQRWISEHEIQRVVAGKGRPSKEDLAPGFTATIKELNAQGFTNTTIALEVAATSNTIGRYLKKVGVEVHRGRPKKHR